MKTPYPFSKTQVVAAGSRSCLLVVTLGLFVGCERSNEQPHPVGDINWGAGSANELLSDEQGEQDSGNVIVSDGLITVENGKVTYGRPEVTEEVERKIYKTLSYHRNMARAIEKRIPGGNRGSRQSREEYDLLKRAFMMRYDISESRINSILTKGDQEEWK